MGILFILVLMIFMHIVDAYYLQGWLASAKQKKWWQENAPQKLYRHDYIMALIMHSLSWAFMIMLPIAIDRKFAVTWIYAVGLIVNATVHGIVDNLKANKLKINLIQDQSIHIMQIIITFIVYLLVG
jgi:hypothetical protein